MVPLECCSSVCVRVRKSERQQEKTKAWRELAVVVLRLVSELESVGRCERKDWTCLFLEVEISTVKCHRSVWLS